MAVVSTFCIAEVRRLDDDGSHPDFNQAEAERMRRMFGGENLIIRPVTEAIAFRAQDIGTSFPSLMPADCVHIATALDFGVDALFTRDGSGRMGDGAPARCSRMTAGSMDYGSSNHSIRPGRSSTIPGCARAPRPRLSSTCARGWRRCGGRCR